jgi:hypothetical protein
VLLQESGLDAKTETPPHTHRERAQALQHGEAHRVEREKAILLTAWWAFHHVGLSRLGFKDEGA